MSQRVRPRKVYIHGPKPVDYMKMFLEEPGYCGTRDPAEADIFVFTGGPDVDPSWYGELPHQNTRISEWRDESDAMMMSQISGYLADNPSILVVGICRGAQFLNIWQGGKMWQHVDGHQGGLHDIIDNDTGQVYAVTSTHHQMMIPHETGIVLAVAMESKQKESGHQIQDPEDPPEVWLRKRADKTSIHHDDPEVIWYSGTRSLCFQPHPEKTGYGPMNESRTYFFSLIERLL